MTATEGRRLGVTGWRQRRAHLGLRVPRSRQGLRGGRCRLAQLVRAEDPADCFHVLVDRVPVVRLLDHVSAPRSRPVGPHVPGLPGSRRFSATNTTTRRVTSLSGR